MESTDSLAASRNQALELVARSKDRLLILPESPARQLLCAISDATIDREF